MSVDLFWSFFVQVSTWSVEELRMRLASLDPQMEQEIEEIRQRYKAKRQPILDAIAAKKRLQQNFWEGSAELFYSTNTRVVSLLVRLLF